MKLLILDTGTSSMRGTILDEGADKIWQGQVAYSPSYMENGWVEESPEDWSSAVRSLCADAAEVCRINAVALTSQRSSVIPIDRQGKPLSNAVMWQDTRCQDICERLQGTEERVRQLTGAGLNTVFAGAKMAWIREHEPDLYENAEKLAAVPDYLIRDMTGQFVTDHTYGSRSLLMDIRTRQWSMEMLDLFGISADKLCRLIAPSEIAGTICESFSHDTGLSTGIPVVSCGGDQQCAALGQGVVEPGRTVVNLGTGAYLITGIPTVPEHIPKDLICNAAAIPDQYILEANVLTCGAAVDWFLQDEDYAMVGQSLRVSPPGAKGVLAMPYFQGRSSPDWDSFARGAFWGLSLKTSRMDMLRALLESIAIEVGRSLKSIETFQPVNAITLSGGLARTPEIRQLLADVTGVRVFCYDDPEATTRGAWMSATHRLCRKEDWLETWHRARPESVHTYRPEPARTALYAEEADRIEAFYQQTRPLSRG